GLRTLLRLGRNMVGPDHIAPELDFALKQSGRRFGRFLIVRVQIHAAIGVCCAEAPLAITTEKKIDPASARIQVVMTIHMALPLGPSSSFSFAANKKPRRDAD